MLPGRRKSAEPAKAGREGTSDPKNGPASEFAKERETEPMDEAPSEGSSPTRKWVGQSKDLWSAGVRLASARQGRRDHSPSAAGKACKARRSDSTWGRGGSYSGQRAWEPARVADPAGSVGRSDRRTREAGAERDARGFVELLPRRRRPDRWRGVRWKIGAVEKGQVQLHGGSPCTARTRRVGRKERP